MANKAISDTGPIIHLTEIELITALDIFSSILIPEEVSNELRLSKTPIPKKIKIIGLLAGTYGEMYQQKRMPIQSRKQPRKTQMSCMKIMVPQGPRSIALRALVTKVVPPASV